MNKCIDCEKSCDIDKCIWVKTLEQMPNGCKLDKSGNIVECPNFVYDYESIYNYNKAKFDKLCLEYEKVCFELFENEDNSKYHNIWIRRQIIYNSLKRILSKFPNFQIPNFQKYFSICRIVSLLQKQFEEYEQTHNLKIRQLILCNTNRLFKLSKEYANLFKKQLKKIDMEIKNGNTKD